MNFQEQLNQLVNEYVVNRREEFAGHPVGRLIRNEIPTRLYASVVDEV